MTPKRLVVSLVLAVFAALAMVSSAPAGNFDEEKMGCAGENPATCATGTVGKPYSITIYLLPPVAGERGEDFGCATFHHTGGTFPPGLVVTDEGYITGTPTVAGTYQFYLTVKYDKPGCFKVASDDQFIIPIVPGTPALSIGAPATIPPVTVGTQYSLAMTANLPDAKTWSISGTPPPGLTIDPATGVISGTPTTAGTYSFTVHAQISPTRTASTNVTLNVRDALTITGLDDPVLEVGVGFKTALKGAGGLRTYKWALTEGALPPGMTFWPGGAITGRPTEAGDYDFVVTLTDSEGRTATYEDTLSVAERFVIETTRIKGKVGRALSVDVKRQGGVGPDIRLKRGPLPPGVRFDRGTVKFVGIPKKAGTWVVVVEGVDSLKVKARSTIVIVIAPGKRK